MRALWERHGKSGTGVEEGEIEKLASKIAGADLSAFFAHVVEGTADIDLATLLRDMGIDMTWRLPAGAANGNPTPSWLGARIVAEANGDAKLANVFDGGPAQACGLSAGDVIVALDGLRVTAGTLEKRIRGYPPGSRVGVQAFRRDEWMSFDLTLAAQPEQVCVLTMRDTPVEAKRRRNDWLLGPAARAHA
jgi:predicted metalloprotease with PDZ domain